MTHVDTEICKRICDFCDKRTGYCLLALEKREEKDKVCISHIDMRVDFRVNKRK